jgi:hypothetical protein
MREFINIVESKTVTDDWFTTNSFVAFKKPDRREPFEIAQKPGTMQTLEGPVGYKKGDYIVTGPKGEQYPIGPEVFQDLKVDNGDGTASPKRIDKLVKLADHDGFVTLKYNGSNLNYKKGEDYIVRHGPNDYGVVKADIFQQTYQKV